MQLYLNAGFGELLGADTLSALIARNFSGIRQDIPNLDVAPTLIDELALCEPPLSGILLLGPGKTTFDPSALALQGVAVALWIQQHHACNRFAIECINEPSLSVRYRDRPQSFSEAVRRVYDAIKGVDAGITVISGGIANTTKDDLDYLRAAMAWTPTGGWPQDLVVGYHTYRTTNRPGDPHSGFATRPDEFAELKGIAEGRRIWCTEVGWHTAPSKVGWFGKTLQYTDDDVARFAKEEWAYHQAAGAEAFTWFQLNDGPDPDAYEQRFGIRRMDGSWKPVADSLQRLGAAA